MQKESVQVYEQDIVGDGINSLKKVIEPRKDNSNHCIRYLLISVSVLFIFIMLILPLFVVIVRALQDGWAVYQKAVLDEYTLKALWLTIQAVICAVIINTIFGIFASWLVSKYYFKGRRFLTTLIDIPFSISPVIAGLIFILTFGNVGWMGNFLKTNGLKIVFAVPGIILATIFVTFPFVFRELLPVLNAQGREEEEAAALMGAGGFTIFRKITFPHIKWALLYGIILCTARAMGEFGAVSVVSGHLRGKTNTLSLHVEILYNEFNTTAAFAVSSILVVLAVLILIVRNVVGWKRK